MFPASRLLIFFPFFWSLFSCQAYRKAPTEWNRSPTVALRSKLYKQEKTNTVKIKHFPPLLFVGLLLPRPRLVPGVRVFPVSSEAPLMWPGDFWGWERGGVRGCLISQILPARCLKWWPLIDPEPACGGGDKVVFVVHLCAARASLSLLQIGAIRLLQVLGEAGEGKDLVLRTKEFPLLSD